MIRTASKTLPVTRPHPSMQATHVPQTPASIDKGAAHVGRPPSGKIRVTMLLRPETVAKFKATGPGWQARISAILDALKP